MINLKCFLGGEGGREGWGLPWCRGCRECRGQWRAGWGWGIWRGTQSLWGVLLNQLKNYECCPCHMSHTCHMSQSHVPCHFDRVSGLLDFARLNVSKVIVLSIVKIAEAIVKIVRNCWVFQELPEIVRNWKIKKCQNCGEVMFSYYSDQMSQRSQVSRVTL